MTLASITLGPLQFDQPVWLALVVVCGALVVWIGRQSLSGMGTTARRVALGVRLVVILLIAAALARPSWRREAENVNVTVILDKSESVPKDLQRSAESWLREASRRYRAGDLISRIAVAREALVQNLPASPADEADAIQLAGTDGTNLAEAGRLGMATKPADTANRLLFVSDFNETIGDVRSFADTAAAAGVPIDVVILPYNHENEVIVDRVVVPSTARMGQNVNLRVLITSLKPTTGRLTLLINGEPVDLDADGPGLSRRVALDEGLNALWVPISLPRAGPQTFRAVFEPDDPAADSIKENNESLAVTFVQSEGRVLIIAPDTSEAEPIDRALTESRIACEVITPAQAPQSLIELQAWDAVIMVNTPSDQIAMRLQEELKAYVHDLGGGLMMVGGPDSFGAGGWLGSPLADALPVRLDPPQKRQMPRGALVLVMHSCEMPQGNYWAKQTGLAAINNLSRLDLIGVVEYNFSRDATWVHPITEVGNRTAVTRAMNSLTFGDAPSFDTMLRLAYNGLVAADAGAKHMIVMSDGDPSFTDFNLLNQCRAAKISISTVLVYPHERSATGPSGQQMKMIADRTGGKFYPIVDQGQFAQLPSIFVKEAQIVKRSLIWEGPPFSPTMVNAVAEPVRGLGGSVPPIQGYVVAADRDGLSVVTLRGKENDPILAHWQHGLGKVVAFTSDAGQRWARSWPSWGKYRAFWDGHVRWMMRPGGNADMRVVTEDLGDKTRVVVEALDASGERMNFVRFFPRVVRPDGTAEAVEMRQVGPGRYEGVFDSARAGAYVANLKYVAPPETPGGQPREGNLQVAVTRPFADEFRTLRDNAPLGRLIAERTGGRVIDLSQSPGQVDLWLRDGLKMPVAVRPIWLLVALLAVALFLVDVAVRRVRIDPQLIAAAVRRAMGRGASRGSEQTGTLLEARKRARAGMAAKASTAEQREALRTAARADEQIAKAKFEVSASELAAAKENLAVPTFDDAPRAAPSQRKQAEAAADAGEGGLARLRKAKERAREDMKDGDGKR